MLPQDLGKSSNDLLSKDFPIFGTALEVKTKTPSGVTFKVAGNRDARSSFIAGDLEAKYSDFKKGLTYTQSWSTANAVRAQLELENNFAKGLKLDVTGLLVPDKGAKSAVINATYKQPGLHSRALLDVYKVSISLFFHYCFALLFLGSYLGINGHLVTLHAEEQ